MRKAAIFSAVLMLGALSTPSSGLAGAHASPHPGEAVYLRGCIACHGEDGAGAMPGLPDLTDKDGPLSKPAGELFKNIWNGVESGAFPEPMPPKGGDDDLTKPEIRQVLEYMRQEFGG